MTFSELPLNERLQAALKRLGFSNPTPIQSEGIPPLLEGKDLVGTAKTGTGKTLAFALPVLNRLMAGQPRKPHCTRALILAPTRELAMQINQVFTTLLPGLHLRSATVYGGVGFRPQENALRGGAEIIVACPGRLLDHMQAGVADLRFVETLVLDEADQMFDMGFLPPLRQIISRLPEERQSMLFSATFAPELKDLIREVCKDPIRVNVSTGEAVHTVSHAIYPVPAHLKGEMILRIMQQESEGTVLIFTRTKHRANKVAEKLERTGMKVGVLHSNKSQSQRQRALADFKGGKIRVLVATDIAARGIDVSGITHVINFDIPESATTYIHRIGRTGRAEATGDALSLVSREDLGTLRDIERTLGKPIERREMPDFDYNQVAPQRTPAEQSEDQRDRGRRPPSGGRAGGRFAARSGPSRSGARSR